ncbi:cytochrome c oxidase subunit 5A, mitochondrial [Daktulosphaira vitifoliae]|uniref:cytochrome c oxidase subunit 5A, mitochondrial n=1 Tax=Daktulosphaira vitifoliae TaxID=58002 RepID=UPI0021AB06DF|nr:cytochrome c oxidase subunit 5A, mitochondrial [Daktulosphaira vitifoliae]
MFISVIRACTQVSRGAIAMRHSGIKPVMAISVRNMSEHKEESDEEFYSRYEAYFNRNDIDGWEARKAMNDLAGQDAVADPKVIIAALKACRRLNDYAMAIRFLESIRIKSQIDSKIYPYILQEISPTLEELGIETPEALGYDKPELALEDVDHIY